MFVIDDVATILYMANREPDALEKATRKALEEVRKCADVAQLAEQLICNQQVIGSSPVVGFLGGNDGSDQPCNISASAENEIND